MTQNAARRPAINLEPRWRPASKSRTLARPTLPWPCAGSFLVVDKSSASRRGSRARTAWGPGFGDDHQGGVDGDGASPGRLEWSFSELVQARLSPSRLAWSRGIARRVPVGRTWIVPLRRREGSSRLAWGQVHRRVARRAVAGNPRPRHALGAHGTARVRLHSRMTSRTSCSIRRSPHLFGWPGRSRSEGGGRSCPSGSPFGIGRVICPHEL